MVCYGNVFSMLHIYETLLDNSDQPVFLKLIPDIKVKVVAKLYSMTARCVHKPTLGFLCQIIEDLCS